MGFIDPESPCRILITGVTGFLGKVVLEELFRRRHEYSLHKVVVLIRNKGEISAESRFHTEVVSSSCFSKLCDGWAETVQVIASDLSQPNCGLDSETYKRLCMDITHIVHCAGTVDFDLPVAKAAFANIDSSLNILELARNSPGLRHMVSTSTAYVRPHTSSPIYEVLAPLPIPAAALYEEIRTGRINEEDLLRLTGHPNTYTLTKCIGEHLMIERSGEVPVTIVRPSIISASWKYPFPGWIDSHSALAAPVALFGMGYLHVLDAQPGTVLDVVPVDVVAARLICEVKLAPGDWSSQGPTGGPQASRNSSIVHSVATLKNGCQIGAISSTSIDFFRNHQVGSYPVLLYSGPRNLLYHFWELISQKIPLLLIMWYHMICGDSKKRRQTARLAKIIGSVNQLFPYFTHHSFDFRTEEPMAEDFDPDTYLPIVCRGVHKHLLKGSSTEVHLAGKHQRASLIGDILWSWSMPNGTLAVRCAATVLRTVFRQIFSLVTFDQTSFELAVEAAQKHGDKNIRLVIIPTHRSYFDFLLLPYLFFAQPNLGIAIPYTAAASSFASVAGIGWAFGKLQAFYVRRGSGKADSNLDAQVQELVNQGETLQFFIEGQRSRSRQFLRPRRGMLRSLQNTGMKFAILPVNISYDRVAEEASFQLENKGHASYHHEKQVKLLDLFRWIGRMMRGKVQLGRAHIRCQEPLHFDPATDVHDLSNKVMASLQAGSTTSTWQLQCFLQQLPKSDIDVCWLRNAIEMRGGHVVCSPPVKIHQQQNVDPVLGRSLQRQWMHFFFEEALVFQPWNPALLHFVVDNSFQSRKEIATRTLDCQLIQLLSGLFRPICKDYVAVAEAARALRGQVVEAKVLLRTTPFEDYSTAEGGLRCLLKLGMLEPVQDRSNFYSVVATEIELDLFIKSCGFGGFEM